MKKQLTIYCIIFFIVNCTKAQSIVECDSFILQGIRFMYNQNYNEALKKLTIAKDIAKEKGLYRQSFLAFNNLGNTYYQMANYADALNAYFEALTLAFTNEKREDEMVVSSNIAVTYVYKKDFKNAEQYFTKAYIIAKTVNNKVRTGYYATNLGMLNVEIKNYKAAQKFIDEALLLLEVDSRAYIIAKLAESKLLIRNNKNLDKLNVNVQYVKNTCLVFGYLGEQNEVNLVIAEIFLNNNKIDSAKIFADSVANNNEDLEKKIEAFDLLSKIAFKAAKYGDAMAYKDSADNTKTLINNKSNQRIYESSKLNIELLNSKNLIKTTIQEASLRRRILVIILLLLSLAFTLLTIGTQRRKMKQNQRLNFLQNVIANLQLNLEKESQQTIIANTQLKEKENLAKLVQLQTIEAETTSKKLELQLNKTLTNSEEDKKKLKDELELKNKQLAERILVQNTRNELLDEMLKSFANESITNTESANKLQNLQRHLKQENNWNQFNNIYQDVNPKFIAALKLHANQALNANEIKFLSFIHMNLSTKEIASILNITTDSFRKKKERVSKKLSIPTNQSLFEFLSSLEK